MANLTKQEIEILATFAQAFPHMTREEKNDLLHVGIGIGLFCKQESEERSKANKQN